MRSVPSLAPFLLSLAVLAPALHAAEKNAAPSTPVPASGPVVAPKPHDVRLDWFVDARFGLFIHWGVYSTLADDYAGKRWQRAEQIHWEAKIPNAEYAKLAEKFNPVKFDAREYVRLAKAAGMKYIVLTGKHHDGFAMFKSPSNPYNIVDATPFRRDPVRELAEACREAGLKMCVYYSLGRDWKESDVPSSKINDWDFKPYDMKVSLDAYIERKVKPQLREILTQYGPIGAIWFDTPERTNKKQSADLYAFVRSLQPDCLVNARVGNGLGDYTLTEQTVPASAIKGGRPFEACITMNRHWGVDKFDNDWKSTDTLLRVLIDVASKGGNLLLNVGPTGEGEIPEPSRERLLAMGEWVKVNGEALYGTGRTAFGYEYAATPKPGSSGVDANGEEVKAAPGAQMATAIPKPSGWRCTTKPGVVYIHILDWPGETLELKKFPGKAAAAALLGDAAGALKIVQEGDTVRISLPASAAKHHIPVLRIATGA